ncbi:MAG: sulfatase-like hydrolase/transferase [Prevotella sp.]|jgi:arylsulfatase|nr:sulfatase-like hydrolase/transferase [Prevotella sp.]
MKAMKAMKKQQLILPTAALLPMAATAQQPAQRPNIMIICVDDMGYSDMGCYGGEVQTPNLDGLAADGIRFTQFFNGARSCPSRASLLTGCYPHTVGITGMGLSLTTNCVTIAEVLKTAGYNTAMTGKWHLSLTQGIGNTTDQMAWLSHQNTFNNRPFAPVETYPCNRGFDEHYGTIWGVVNHFDPFSLVHNTDPINTVPSDFYSTDYITDKTIDLIDSYSAQEAPFFMYVAYNAPHWPLHAKPADIAKYDGVYDTGWDVLREQRYNRMVSMGLIDPAQVPVSHNESGRTWANETDKTWLADNMEVHAAMVDCVDQGIGKIIAKLQATGEYDNTIILFMSDNGASSENYTIGEFDRHDRTRDGQMVTHNARTPGSELTYNYIANGWAGAVNTPFRYWKRESFHGGIATPLIVHWNDGIAAAKRGTINHQPGHFIDVMPTVLELTGASYPATYNSNAIQALPAEGRSLLPLIQGEGVWNGERTFFWEHETGKAVRVGDWKLTALTGQGWQLFNLADDYSETENLAAEYPDKVRELKTLWNNWAQSVGLSVAAETPDTPKELVFYYPFDDTFNDESDNSYLLAPSASVPAFAEGKYGKALTLNGTDQYLDMNTTGIINAANTQYTVCAWVYDKSTVIPSSGTTENGYYFRDEIVLAQKDNAGTGRIVLYGRVENPVGGGDVQMFYNSFLGAKQNKASVGTLQRGKWQHVAIVCDPVNKQVTYYIDGVRDQTVSCNAFEACTGGFRIGAHKSGTQSFWTGEIDELYLFKGMLSGDEIRAVRDNTYFDIYGNNQQTQDDLVFYYPFDNTFSDESDNAYPLTPSASVPTFAEGKYSAALSLNGNGQYLDLDAAGVLDPSITPHTFAMWLYNSATATVNDPPETSGFYEEVAISQKDNAGTGRLAVFAAYDAADPAKSTYTNLYGGSARNATSLGAFERNNWTHVALVSDPATQTVKWYINGVLDNTVVASAAFEPTLGGYRIGAHKNNKCYWTGLIDELYLFRTALSDEDIVKLRDNTYLDEGTSIRENKYYGWNVVYDRERKLLQITPTKAVESIAVYSAAGALLQKARKSGALSVSGLSKGVYIVKAVDAQGNKLSKRIIIN